MKLLYYDGKSWTSNSLVKTEKTNKRIPYLAGLLLTKQPTDYN
jgi:hypothetical protein